MRRSDIRALNESCNYSQSDIQKSYKTVEKKLEFSDELSSEYCGSDINGEGDYVALMFNQIKILITSKNSEMLQTLMKKKFEAC